jgi:hypothetical protein
MSVGKTTGVEVSQEFSVLDLPIMDLVIVPSVLESEVLSWR